MSFDEDAIGSLQLGTEMGSSGMRSGDGGGRAGTPGLGLDGSMSSGTEDECERGARNQQTHTRIGRASPVLKRVCLIFPTSLHLSSTMLIFAVFPILSYSEELCFPVSRKRGERKLKKNRSHTK